jgi:timeless
MQVFSVNWTYDEMDTLFWYYVQSKKTEDPIGNVEKLLKKNGQSEKTRLDVLDQLLKQGIIDNKDYKQYIKVENGELPKVRATETNVRPEIAIVEDKPVDDVQVHSPLYPNKELLRRPFFRGFF